MRIHHIADVQGVCMKLVGSFDLYLGCSWMNPANGTCDVFVPQAPMAFVVAHEKKHCDGYDH